MSNPRFPDPFGRRELLEPGATASGGGLSLEQRVAALEQGAAGKSRPILHYAAMYMTNSGTPQHTSNGGWELVGGSGSQPQVDFGNRNSGNATQDHAVDFISLISMAAGEYLQLYAYQNESANEAYNVTADYWNRLTMIQVGPSV